MRELYRYRDLIRMLVARDLKVRYRRSVIGFLWTMLQPLLTMVVLHLVFSTVFRFNVTNYPVYALSGVLFWNFFNQTIVSSMNSLRQNAAILTRLPVPMEVFPVSTLLSGVINMLFALVPLFAILVVTGHPMGPSLAFVPVAILIAAAFTLGAGLLLSPLAVFFTDIVELVGVVLIMLMYLTPIFYPLSIVKNHQFFWVVRFNPIRSILEVFRDPIYLSKVPPLTHLSLAAGLALVTLILGAIVFRRSSDRIPFFF